MLQKSWIEEAIRSYTSGQPLNRPLPYEPNPEEGSRKSGISKEFQ